MPSTYTSGPHLLDVMGGQEHVIELRCPVRGSIRTIKFDQLDGAAADCEFEVYTKREAAPPTESSLWSSSSWASGPSLGSSSLPAISSAYSIFGKRDYTAGAPFIEADKEYPYQNNDNGPSNRLFRLYARVTPEGDGPKQYVLTFEMGVSPAG